MGNTAKQCRLGLFQDSDFAGDLEDSKSTSGGTLCVFGSHTFVPISWMCKKQTSVSNSSTGSEIISLAARLRLHGIPAFNLWDLIVLVLGNTNQNHDRTGRPVVCRDQNHVRQQSRGVINVLDNVDLVPSNVRFSHQEALLYVFEDNEAVIKMIVKGRSRQWDMFPEPTTPKTNLQTYLPRETSHVMNGIIFCVCLTLAISVIQSVLK